MSLTQSRKIIDHSIGLRNVKETAKRALYEMKDEETGMYVTQPVLNLNLLPRYNNDDDKLSVRLGDLFSAVMCLSQKMDSLNKRVVEIENNTPVNEEICAIVEEQTQMIQHISALESNLRCLRETLTMSDSDEVGGVSIEGPPT